MKKVQLFEPLGATLGCCGGSPTCEKTDNPIVNEHANVKELERIEAFFTQLQSIDGYFVTLHDPSSDPYTFSRTEAVIKKLQVYGEDVLPIVLINDKIASMGEFPSNEKLSQLVGLDYTLDPSPASC
ncbi:hypothetical protein AWM75_04520 [Aerococcus urinaehominis]|uniref:Uncharacterized protein n=1 Tax=Aerococcus urinaehominis TaxID=128944 RepID=A0A109RGM5_9LACT|nr:arsenic metallochaperone ArsD family protein [Aerococcus urinaehominis]AMB99311.1 hypothetical protein AWM75_04520 [Aerococcus urinaehominis]SDM19841.1 Arsenical resistance operon trans-acting repressor ArsD [Aerococcus urinaehominis]